jgi:hypothetical protein
MCSVNKRLRVGSGAWRQECSEVHKVVLGAYNVLVPFTERMSGFRTSHILTEILSK